MKPVRTLIAFTVAALAILFLLFIAIFWLRNRFGSAPVTFSTFDRSIQITTDSQKMSLRIEDQFPTFSAIVTGMMRTPQGWAVQPGHDVEVRIVPLQNNASSDQSSDSQLPPITIERSQGKTWSDGFTASHASLPGPFPAREIKTYHVSYIGAVILSIILLSIGWHYGAKSLTANSTADVNPTAKI
jgi:hypothetical protein